MELFEDFLTEEANRYRSGGNVVEIGAGNGETTLLLCEKFDGMVVAVDPFVSNGDPALDSYFDPYSKDRWRMTTFEYKDRTVLIEKESSDPSVIEELRLYHPITFMFIDGLQTKEAVLKDLRMADALKVKTIAVDDFTRESDISQVPDAVKQFFNEVRHYAWYDTFAYNNGRVIGVMRRR